MLNRSALLVTLKEPYFQWAESLPGDGPSPRGDNDRVVYLVPEIDDPADEKKVVRDAFPMIFEHELWAWHTDEADWPKKRDFKTFLEWFDVEVDSMVMDLYGYDLVDDDDSE